MKVKQELEKLLGKEIAQSSNEEVYYALLNLTKQLADDRRMEETKKKIYYVSAEFLIGKLLSNNMINLGIYEDVKKVLAESGKTLAEIEEIEVEPSLGNGGLGRLAACFLDSIATLGLSGAGIGLNYHLIVLINSMKSKTFINLETFKLPTEESYVGLENYKTAITQYDFLKAVGWTLFITVFSVAVILICCSMTAWFITRVKNVFTKMIYLLCVFSMVIPFQMVMFTLSGTADSLHLNTPWGIVIVYLGFGAGLAVFMFTGFVKSIPVEVEEAAMIDGCSPLRTFFCVVVPMMKPTFISVGILEAMWIWNDFLLPYLVLDIKEFKTISIVIQYMKGSYGRVDMGAIMACLIMAIIPVVVFYLCAQKYIVKGVAAGAVKG